MAENRIFYQQDCDLQKLAGKTVAIIGYGSQGHAHALNLKDSGVNVVIGLYEGSKSWAKAEAQGLKVMTSAEAAKAADIIMILINDEKQAALYKESIAPNLTAGKTLMLAPGRRQRRHGRSQGPGSHRALRVPGRQGHALPRGC